MRYILAASLLLITALTATPAAARRHGHHHRHSHGWYYGAGCHSYYCGGEGGHLRAHHRYSSRSHRYYSLGSRARAEYGY
jgi:hypothetical protein